MVKMFNQEELKEFKEFKVGTYIKRTGPNYTGLPRGYVALLMGIRRNPKNGRITLQLNDSNGKFRPGCGTDSWEFHPQPSGRDTDLNRIVPMSEKLDLAQKIKDQWIKAMPDIKLAHAELREHQREYLKMFDCRSFNPRQVMIMKSRTCGKTAYQKELIEQFNKEYPMRTLQEATKVTADVYGPQGGFRQTLTAKSEKKMNKKVKKFFEDTNNLGMTIIVRKAVKKVTTNVPTVTEKM